MRANWAPRTSSTPRPSPEPASWRSASQRRRLLQRRRDLCEVSGALSTSGEKFWRLPLGDEYADLIKSDIGDIKNTGGRAGGAITAAEFLKVFAEDTPWIHLDIAGMAWIEDSRPYIAKGPSGVAVRSILEWVRSY